jgi:hypothetical protein
VARADYPEYSKLAARIAVSNLHKQTKKSFTEVMTDLRQYVNPKTGKKSPLVSRHGEAAMVVARDGAHPKLTWPSAAQSTSSSSTTKRS